MPEHATNTPSPTPPDPVLLALQAELARMDVRLKALQNQQAGLTALLPASAATPNSGAFTVSGANAFPSQRLAYLQLQHIAARLVKGLKLEGPVIIYDQAEINALMNYAAVMKVLGGSSAQVQQLRDRFDGHLQPAAQRLLTLPKPAVAVVAAAAAAAVAPAAIAPILVPGLALAGLKTASDLIGMFRTNTTIAYGNPALDDAALVAAVVHEIHAKGAGATYMPAVVPASPADDASAFMDLLATLQADLSDLQYRSGLAQAKLQQLSDSLGAYIAADEASQANQDALAVQTDPATLLPLKARQPGLERASEAARQVVLGLLASPTAPLDAVLANKLKAERDQFLKELAAFVALAAGAAAAFATVQAALASISATATAAMTAVLRAEKLATVAKTAKASILLLRTSVLAGSVVTRTNLFTGGHLSFTGGAIANFTQFDAATGAVLASGVEVAAGAGEKQDF